MNMESIFCYCSAAIKKKKNVLAILSGLTLYNIKLD